MEESPQLNFTFNSVKQVCCFRACSFYVGYYLDPRTDIIDY